MSVPNRIFALFLSACGCLAQAAQAEPNYRLGPQDNLILQFFEPFADDTTAATWAALSRQYTITTEGVLNVPVIGPVEAAGKTIPEITATLEETLFGKLGLTSTPSIAIEIIGYTPISVLGYVNAPGLYSLAPGAAVQSAFAAAGGREKRTFASDQYAALRDTRTATEAIARAQTRRAWLRGQLARLRAQAAGEADIIFPDLLGHPGGARAEAEIQARQSEIYAETLAALASNMTELRTRKALAKNQTRKLESKLVELNKTLETVRKSERDIQNLLERGLARAERLTAVQTNIVNLSNSLLLVEQSIFEVRKEMDRIDIELERKPIDLRAAADLEISNILANIDAADGDIAGGQDLLSLASNDKAELDGSDKRRARIGYRIIRRSGETLEGASIMMSSDTMMPGDILIVTPPMD